MCALLTLDMDLTRISGIAQLLLELQLAKSLNGVSACVRAIFTGDGNRGRGSALVEAELSTDDFRLVMLSADICS